MNDILYNFIKDRDSINIILNYKYEIEQKERKQKINNEILYFMKTKKNIISSLQFLRYIDFIDFIDNKHIDFVYPRIIKIYNFLFN
jgi:hypothetical protein